MTSHPTRTVAAIAASFALALTLGACGSDGGEKAESGDSTTTEATTDNTTTTAEDTGSTTAATTAVDDETTSTTENNEGRDTETTELDTLEDGDHYGYMAGLENGKVEGQDVQVIIFDKVEFLTGQEAIDVAEEDNVELDTDYYIRNQNQTVRRLAVVPDASIFTLKDGSAEQVASSVDEVTAQPHLFKINAQNVRDITTLSSIEAVYLP